MQVPEPRTAQPRRRLRLAAAVTVAALLLAGGVWIVQARWKGAASVAPRAPRGKPPATAAAPFKASKARAFQTAWARYLDVPLEYENSLGMKFMLIPPGEFLMGSTDFEIAEAIRSVGEDAFSRSCVASEAPRHKTVLTQPFYLGVHEVTQAQYEKIMARQPSHFSEAGPGKEAVAGLNTAAHPVEQVSWNDATEFCVELSRLEDREPFYNLDHDALSLSGGAGYRLPTEAEWEFACRAGTTVRFWTGDIDEGLARAAWFDANSEGRTHRVGELKPNPFGLYDIHGNVWEWVYDAWEPASYSKFRKSAALDPIGPSDADLPRGLRGGGWNFGSATCRSSARLADDPLHRRSNVGFRLVLAVPGQPADR